MNIQKRPTCGAATLSGAFWEVLARPIFHLGTSVLVEYPTLHPYDTYCYASLRIVAHFSERPERLY
jgi:hypothetical protein